MKDINIIIGIVIAVVVLGFIVGMTRENLNFSLGGSTDKEKSGGFLNFGDKGKQFGIGGQTGKDGTSGNISYTDEETVMYKSPFGDPSPPRESPFAGRPSIFELYNKN